MKAENCHTPSPSGPRDHPHLPISWHLKDTPCPSGSIGDKHKHTMVLFPKLTRVTQTTRSLTATLGLTEIAVVSTSVSLIFIPVWGFQIATSSFKILSQNDSDTFDFEQKSSTQEWLCKTGKSSRCVWLFVCCTKVPSDKCSCPHKHTHTDLQWVP